MTDDTWAVIAPYPHPVAHPAACAIGGDIYVVGGGGNTVSTRERQKVFCYSPNTDTWTEKCAFLVSFLWATFVQAY